jgi:uncharacterized protein (TIGR03382 family)
MSTVSPRRPAHASVLLLCALSAWLLSPRSAQANGRSPATVSVHLRPGSTMDLAVWSTWGFLISDDGGATFRWMCENALKVGGAFDPELVFRGDGSIVSNSFEGLLVNRDGCTFETTGLGAKFVSTIADGPDGALYAAVVERDDSKIYKSSDGGKTFPVSAMPGQLNDWWQSLEAAPLDLQRLYLSGYRLAGGVKTQLLFRSVNGGVSYPLPQAGTGLSSDLEIAAVSPTNPELLFARVTYAKGDVLGDRIYRSVNGGQAWTEVLYVADTLRVVARKNGDVLAASAKSGTWKSVAGAAFVKQATSLQTQCLTERSDGTLFACAQNFAPDNMAIGSSTDGVTWTKVFRFSEAAGPVDCAAETLQCSVCQLTVWCALREQFGISADPTTCAEPGGDGTVCGGPVAPDKEPSSGGCCDAGGGPGGLLLGLLVGGLLLRRRPRQALR